MTPDLTDDRLLRYSRHLLLDEIGIGGQQRLLGAHAVIVGAGGLGSPAALYLGSAGVGRLTIVDHDTVDATNLQRQVAHDITRLGWPKAVSAAASVRAINPDVDVRALVRRADEALLAELAAGADVVLDCTDNFRTRHAVNAACVAAATPLVWGAAIRFDAQLSTFDPHDATCPCYACVFPPQAAHEDVACAQMGVFAPLVGLVGSWQAAEALKLLAGTGTTLAGRLAMFDAHGAAASELHLPRDPGCAVCAGRRTPPRG
jgi:molybdopterin/thiamine biosynthesis adenylyltransferase